jgi:uncharacterized protein YigA (DUF484 family)
VFGLIRKSAVQKHLDRAIDNVSARLEKIHRAEIEKLNARHADALRFLAAEKEAEIDEYCRQNTALRDIIARMEYEKEEIKQGAITNSRLANSIDSIAKNILDTTDKMRDDLVRSVSGEIKKFYETLGSHWQKTSEIVNATRAQQKRMIK